MGSVLAHFSSARGGAKSRGDRQADSALWWIVITRMVCDACTRDCIERRMKEGLTKKEEFRCLKRFIAREVYNHLPRQQLALDSPLGASFRGSGS